MKYKIASELIDLYRKAVTDLKNTKHKDCKTYLSFLHSFEEVNIQVMLGLMEHKGEAYGADDIAEFYFQLWQEGEIEQNSISNITCQNLVNLMCSFQDYTQECAEKIRCKSAEIAQGLSYFLPLINEKLKKNVITLPPGNDSEIANNYFSQLEQDEKIIPTAALLSNNILQLEFDPNFLSENTANYYQTIELNQLISEKIDTVTQVAGHIFKQIKEKRADQFNKNDDYEIGGRRSKNYRLDPDLPLAQNVASVKDFFKRKNDISEANCNLLLSLLLQTQVGIQFAMTDWLNAFLIPLAENFSNFDTIIKHSNQQSISIDYKEVGSATLNFELPVVCGPPDNVEKVGKSNFSVEVTYQGKIKFSPIRTELYHTEKTELSKLVGMLTDKAKDSPYRNVHMEVSLMKQNEPGQFNQPRIASNAAQRLFYNAVNLIRKVYEYFGLLKPQNKPIPEKSIFRFDIKPAQPNLLAESITVMPDIKQAAKTLAQPILFERTITNTGLHTKPDRNKKDEKIPDNIAAADARILRRVP